MARHKSETPYCLTVTNTHGVELWSFSGSLLKLLSVFSEANDYTAAPIDTYSRIRRELLASGGAYSRYYPGVDGLPVRVEVIEEKNLAPYIPSAEVFPTDQGAVAASNYADALHRYGNLGALHPDRCSGWATSPVVQVEQRASPDFVPVECTSCRLNFLQNPEFGNTICAACFSGERGPVFPLSQKSK